MLTRFRHNRSLAYLALALIVWAASWSAPGAAPKPGAGSPFGSSKPSGLNQYFDIGEFVYERLFGEYEEYASPVYFMDQVVQDAGTFDAISFDDQAVSLELVRTDPIPYAVGINETIPDYMSTLRLVFGTIASGQDSVDVVGITASRSGEFPEHVFMVLDDLDDFFDGTPYTIEMLERASRAPERPRLGRTDTDDCNNVPCYYPPYECPDGSLHSQCTCEARWVRQTISNNLQGCLDAAIEDLVWCLVPAAIRLGAIAFCLGACSVVPPPGNISCYLVCAGIAGDLAENLYDCFRDFNNAKDACYQAVGDDTFDYYCNGNLPIPH